MIPFPPELNDWEVIDKATKMRGNFIGYGGQLEQKYNLFGFATNLKGCTFSEKWMCGCCGSGEIRDVSFRIENKESFLSAFLSVAGYETTWYFIADDYQMSTLKLSFEYPRDFIDLMIDCGAKLVDETFNQNHGPSKMNLFVWSPNLHKDKIAKYINPETFSPNWWVKMTDPQRDKYIKSNQEILTQRKEAEAARVRAAELQTVRTDEAKLYDLIHKYPEKAEKWISKLKAVQNVKY